MGSFLLQAEAERHTILMEEKYLAEIERSFTKSKIYQPDFEMPNDNTANLEMKITFLTGTTTDALNTLYETDNKRVALLNFASYKNPGGQFLGGSSAQEENLCHNSYLYNVLKRFPAYYNWNRQNLNNGLYLNRAIYSPDIKFFIGDKTILTDVITCAAPNKTCCIHYNSFTLEENSKALNSRIKFILDIAKSNRVDILILGAFGAGVFKQDAKEVAEIFNTYLNTTHKCFKEVIFAVPEGRNNYNHEIFQSIFGNR